MRIAFPLDEIKEDVLQSNISKHFGKTKVFLIYDTANKNHEIVEFSKTSEGTCFPAKFLMDRKIDAIYVLGMGYRAKLLLENAGIKVLSGEYDKVKDVLTNLDKLKPFEDVCREEH